MSAQNSRRSVEYVLESTFGVTPGTPQTTALEFTSYESTLNTEQLDSANITPHRQTTFSRRGNTGAEGTLGIEVAPDNYDWVLENLFRSTFVSDVLKPGNTQTSYAIQEGFEDIGQYQVTNGVRFNSMKLNITPEALVTAEFGFMGTGVSALTAVELDGTPTPAVPKPSFFHEGGTISEGGTPVAFITAMTVEVDNGMSGNYALGSTSYRSLSDGKFTATGSVTALFESAALYNKFRNGTPSTISVTLVAGAETLQIALPDVRYTTGNFDRGGDGPVLVTCGFTGVYNLAAAASITITRSV